MEEATENKDFIEDAEEEEVDIDDEFEDIEEEDFAKDNGSGSYSTG